MDENLYEQIAENAKISAEQLLATGEIDQAGERINETYNTLCEHKNYTTGGIKEAQKFSREHPQNNAIPIIRKKMMEAQARENDIRNQMIYLSEIWETLLAETKLGPNDRYLQDRFRNKFK